MFTKIDDLLSSFARTTDEIFSLDELKLLLDSGRKLRIKYGVDVTAPQLHIGHAVNLWMMRALQDAGHKVIFLIGDYTTSIGDPTGKNKLRPIISNEEIKANTEMFIRQVKMVLRFEPELLEIRRNSEWLDKLSSRELLNLLSMVTHNRLLSREMFQRRISAGEDIYMHEAIYPVLQGYDSVALESDLTIIGTDIMVQKPPPLKKSGLNRLFLNGKYLMKYQRCIVQLINSAHLSCCANGLVVRSQIVLCAV
jgi:tyrosyl-tRNA synthetase